MFTNWRDCKQWADIGLPLSSTSNESCKLYDAVLTQYVGWYDDDSVGGIEASAEKLLRSDPQFVMGKVLVNGLNVMATGRNLNADFEFRKSLDSMVELGKQSANLTQREKQHVNAMKLCSDGFMTEACSVWEDILVQHPTDMLALKFAYDSYYYLGYREHIRDTLARVIPHWKSDMPLYGYLMGMYSYGLVETEFYTQAETVARKGLELNPCDATSTHSMAHVFEMTGMSKEGISFLNTTVRDWSTCGMLASHNFWHMAIYHIEQGDYTAALDIFDSELVVRCYKSGALTHIVDSCSLLYRLQLEGVEIGNRWEDVYKMCSPLIDDHIFDGFNGAHILMSCLGAKKGDIAKKIIKSMENVVRNARDTKNDMIAEVGLTICEALQAYDEGDVTKAVDFLYPIRHQIIKIGGSNAERDVFNLFLIHAALKSNLSEHNKLARLLLAERKALKKNAPMTDRLIARALSCMGE